MNGTEAELLAAHGTPKQGIDCGRCDDWGTVVIERGRTFYEVICPVEGCKAAERARVRRSDG